MCLKRHSHASIIDSLYEFIIFWLCVLMAVWSISSQALCWEDRTMSKSTCTAPEGRGSASAACLLITCRKHGVCNCCATSGAWRPLPSVTRGALSWRGFSFLPPQTAVNIHFNQAERRVLRLVREETGESFHQLRLTLLWNAARPSHRTGGDDDDDDGDDDDDNDDEGLSDCPCLNSWTWK